MSLEHPEDLDSRFEKALTEIVPDVQLKEQVVVNLSGELNL